MLAGYRPVPFAGVAARVAALEDQERRLLHRPLSHTYFIYRWTSGDNADRATAE